MGWEVGWDKASGFNDYGPDMFDQLWHCDVVNCGFLRNWSHANSLQPGIHMCVCVCNGMVFWLKAFYDIVIVVIVDDGGQQMILNRIVVPSESDSRPPNLVLPTRSMQFSSLAWRCKWSNRNIYHDDFQESLTKSSHGGITGISWTFSCLFFRIGVSRGNRSSYACASVKC